MRLFLIFAAGCVGVSTTKDDSSGGAAACELAAAACDECYDGPVTCAFEGYQATANSCGDCQARAALNQALCDAGVDATAADLEAGTTCVPTECVVTYGCSCTPSCDAAYVAAPATSSTAQDPCTTCATPEDPPGACEWNGSACAFTVE